MVLISNNPTTKIVQDKDGVEVQVPFDTPCHAGENGALPTMLDATVDAKVFAEIAQREAVYASQAPERDLAKVIEQRKQAYGTIEQQLERIIEDGIASEVTRVAQIKLENPKPNV